MVGFYHSKVVRHGYRKATVVNRVAALKFKSGDSVEEMRKELAFLAKAEPDNHECYECVKEDGTKVCFQFSDWTCYIGTDITESEEQ